MNTFSNSHYLFGYLHAFYARRYAVIVGLYVSLFVCLAQVRVLPRQLNLASRKQPRTIKQGL